MTTSSAPHARIQLRPARADEGAALSDLAFRAKAAWGYPAAVMARWRDVLRIDPTASPTWVAEIDGETVGTVAWLIDGHRAELTDLWVQPGRQRAGVGRRLLALALDHIRQQGFSRVHIDAEPLAAGFYQRCGARLISALPAPIDGDPGRKRPQFELDLSGAPGA